MSFFHFETSKLSIPKILHIFFELDKIFTQYVLGLLFNFLVFVPSIELEIQIACWNVSFSLQIDRQPLGDKFAT